MYEVLLGSVSAAAEKLGALPEEPLKLTVDVPIVEVAYTARSCPPPEPLPLPTQVPLREKQPAVRLRPLARDEVAREEEYRALEKVVDALVMEKRASVEVAKVLGEEEAR
jgi:hypothetical protein